MSEKKMMIDPVDVQALLDEYDSTDQGYSDFENLINGLRDLLPKHDYPEDMLGMWAVHPVHGRVLVSRTKPDDDGEVTIIWNDGLTDRMRNVSVSELSFPDQHPETLTTMEDYKNAPRGTIVSDDNDRPLFRDAYGLWKNTHGDSIEPGHLHFPRRVLRWGWGE